MDEWARMDWRPPFQNQFSKLKPFKGKVTKQLDTPPVVHAAPMRLARCLTLPFEDAVILKEVLNSRTYQDLKQTFSSAGDASKVAIALASVSKVVEVRDHRFDAVFQGQEEEAEAEYQASRSLHH